MMSRVRAPSTLLEADLLGAPLGGEGGEREEAEAADDDREQGRGGEDVAARLVGIVHFGDHVRDEHGFERHVGGVAPPDPARCRRRLPAAGWPAKRTTRLPWPLRVI